MKVTHQHASQAQLHLKSIISRIAMGSSGMFGTIDPSLAASSHDDTASLSTAAKTLQAQVLNNMAGVRGFYF